MGIFGKILRTSSGLSKEITSKENNKLTLLDQSNQNSIKEILQNFSYPLIVFSDEDINEVLINQRIFLLVNKLNLSSSEIVIFFRTESKQKHFNAQLFWNILKERRFNNANFNIPEVRRNIFDRLDFENNYKAFIIISPCDYDPILHEFVSRIKRRHNNILWLLNQEETPYEDNVLKGIFKIYNKYNIRAFQETKDQDNKKINTLVKIEPTLLSHASCSFDSSFLKFLSFDKLLLFSKHEEILKQAIKVRNTLVGQRFKKVLLFSEITNEDPLDSIEKADSIIFDIETPESIIQFAITKVSSIFVALASDRGISKIFKKYCKEFYAINLGANFNGRCKKFKKIPITCNSVEEAYLDSKVKDCIKENNCILYSEKVDNLDLVTKLTLDYLSSQKIKTAFISSSVDNDFWNWDSWVSKVNFEKLKEKWSLLEFNTIFIYEKNQWDLDKSINLIFKIGKKIILYSSAYQSNISLNFIKNFQRFAYLKFLPNLSVEATIFSKSYLSLSFVNPPEEKFELDTEVSKYIKAKNKCLVISQTSKISREIVNERINFLIKENNRILLISSPWKEWENHPSVTKCSFQYFLSKYHDLKVANDFDAIVIYEINNENLKKLVVFNSVGVDSLFVCLWNNWEEIQQIFNEYCKKFVCLNFGDRSSAHAKVFNTTFLTLGLENIEKEHFRLDSKISDYISENKCLLFSEREEILENLVKLKINSLVGKRILLISYLFSEIKLINLEKSVIFYDLKSFLKEYLFKEKDLPENWEIDFNNRLSNFNFRNYLFDAIIFLESPNEYLIRIISKALNDIENVFVGLNKNHKDVLQIFKDNTERFVYLNFGSGLSAQARVFNQPYLSLSSETIVSEKSKSVTEVEKTLFNFEEKNETKDTDETNPFETLLEDAISKQSLKILENFSKPLLIFSENEEICKKLASDRVFSLVNKLGLSSREIIACFNYIYKDDPNIGVESFWRVFEELCKNDLSIIKNDFRRNVIFNHANFKKNYKAFIIIAPLDCHIALKDLISRVIDVGNVVWFAFGENFSEKAISLDSKLLSRFSKYKAKNLSNGEEVIIEKIFERNSITNKSITPLFDEEQEEDVVLAKQPIIINDEEDELFDQSLVVKLTDEEDDGEKEDIGGGLDSD